MSQYYWIAAIDRTAGSDHIVWWAPNRCGYVANLLEAGLYSMSEVLEICRGDCGEILHVPFEAGAFPQGAKLIVSRRQSRYDELLRRLQQSSFGEVSS